MLHIKMQPFADDIRFYFGDAEKELAAKYANKTNNAYIELNTDEYTLCWCNGVIVWLNEYPSDEDSIGNLCHESTHVAQNIASHKGISDDEFVSYTTGYLVTKVLAHVGKLQASGGLT